MIAVLLWRKDALNLNNVRMHVTNEKGETRTPLASHKYEKRQRIAHVDGSGDPGPGGSVAPSDLHVTLWRGECEVNWICGVHPVSKRVLTSEKTIWISH